MSMNLTARDVNGAVPLLQTPTSITWMCLSINPKTKKPDGGHQGVLRRYIFWLRGTKSGVWDSEEELREYSEGIEKDILDLIYRKGLKFSYT